MKTCPSVVLLMLVICTQSVYSVEPQDILNVLNQVRTNPKSFVPKLEAKLKTTPQSKVAIQEAINVLKNMVPINELAWEEVMVEALQDYEADGYATPLWNIMENYGWYEGEPAEIYSFALSNAEEIVLEWLIDADFSDRINRKAVINQDLGFCGIISNSFEIVVVTCVQYFEASISLESAIFDAINQARKYPTSFIPRLKYMLTDTSIDQTKSDAIKECIEALTEATPADELSLDEVISQTLLEYTNDILYKAVQRDSGYNGPNFRSYLSKLGSIRGNIASISQDINYSAKQVVIDWLIDLNEFFKTNRQIIFDSTLKSCGVAQSGGLVFVGFAENFQSTLNLVSQVFNAQNQLRTDPKSFIVILQTRLEDSSLSIEMKNEIENSIEFLTTMNPISQIELDSYITQAAQDHADDMDSNGFYDEFGSDGSDVRQRLSRYGRFNDGVAELYAYGVDDGQKLVVDWLITNRDILLNVNFRYCGIAYAESAQIIVATYAQNFKPFLLIESILIAQNQLRTNPRSFIPKLERKLKELGLGDDTEKAINEAISVLNTMNPVGEVVLVPEITQAVSETPYINDDDVLFQAYQPYNSNFKQRMSKYGKYDGYVAEIFVQAEQQGEKVVINWLIDDAVPNRRNRKVLLNPILKYCGIFSFSESYFFAGYAQKFEPFSLVEKFLAIQNQLRKNPASFISKLQDRLKTYQSTESKAAIQECINYLNTTPSLPEFKSSPGMALVAIDYLNDLDNQLKPADFSTRILRYGKATGLANEIVADKVSNPEDIIIRWLIDSDSMQRVNRNLLLNPKIQFCGLGYSTNNNAIVVSFAENFGDFETFYIKNKKSGQYIYEDPSEKSIAGYTKDKLPAKSGAFWRVFNNRTAERGFIIKNLCTGDMLVQDFQQIISTSTKMDESLLYYQWEIIQIFGEDKIIQNSYWNDLLTESLDGRSIVGYSRNDGGSASLWNIEKVDAKDAYC